MDTYDVAIVGARCAGSPLAAMLARQGLRVCLLDRVRFPRETPSTHVILPCGVQILDELGVLDSVLAAGAVPLDRFTLVNEDVRIDGRVEQPHFSHPGLCVRSVTLDALLVETAAAAGVDVRTRCRVTGVLAAASGRVTGVDTEQGPVRARLTVGADGRTRSLRPPRGPLSISLPHRAAYRPGPTSPASPTPRDDCGSAGKATLRFWPVRPMAASTWPGLPLTLTKSASFTPTENTTSSKGWRAGRNWRIYWPEPSARVRFV